MPARFASQGLSSAEAAARFSSEGPNALPQPTRRGAMRLVVDVLKEPMLALLLAGGLIYLALGSRAEALVLLAFACLSVAITVVQEARTERVLEALRDLTSPRALVIRDGQRQRIAGRDVVRGDLIVLAEGDRVPADGQLLPHAHVTADESLLTGESVPVRKGAGDKADSQVYSGTLIVGGSGLAMVTATGPYSEIGKIGKSLSLLDADPPHLQRQLARLVWWFALIGGAVSLGVVALYGLMRGGDWLGAILAGISVGMSMLPEEFPMVLAVFMAMGAWRISKARVLTRRASAIEALGAASVLCTDKTGTLTENRMTIARLQLENGTSCDADPQMPAKFQRLAQAGTKASAIAPFDPMERAFHSLSPLTEGHLKQSYPLSPDLLAMTQVWQEQDRLTAYAKGAPEAIAALCGMPEGALHPMVEDMAAKGQRVLAVAMAPAPETLPKDQTGFAFSFLGLVGLVDPLREGVPKAVATCKAAGIRVIMITGDHPATAAAIAHEAGLGRGQVVSGDAMAGMTDAALARALRRTSVFARIMPDQKLRIVQVLKASGEIVAMTGDGVNDAPSLKAADIGVAMGGRGTDVAREAASIVLLDDDFGSIVTTITLGRRIYDNLRKAMSFILAVHVPIAGLALLPLVMGTPLLFGPVHIAFLEMIIDPVCALVFEAEEEEKGLMKRPPRPASEPLFSIPTILWSLFQGVVAFAVVAGVFLIVPHYDLTEAQTRALTFAALVMAIVALILVNRVRTASVLAALSRRNRALGLVLCVVAVMLALVMLLPQASALFGFALPSGHWLALPPAAGFGVLVLLELSKPLFARPAPSKPSRT